MKSKAAGVVSALLVASLAGIASAGPHFSPWAPAQPVAEVNTASSDGCPIQSPDRLSLYLASNRPEGTGGLDIWVARRQRPDALWGALEPLPEPINSAVDDFCPTPIRGNGLFFVSRREPGSCGPNDSDIYFARRNPRHGWSDPVHFACAPEGPNSTLDEMGPSYVVGGQALLYFSSGPDIYVSEQLDDGGFGPAQAVGELNSTAADIQPNVRKDGREVVFASNRPSSVVDVITDQNIWSASRESVGEPWSAPLLLGDAVNTADGNETRPSFSWDATTLYFGRAPFPTGPADIFVTSREKVSGSGERPRGARP